LAWSLDRISSRLPQMLARAGADDVAREVDMNLVDRAMPQVKEMAYNARHQARANTPDSAQG